MLSDSGKITPGDRDCRYPSPGVVNMSSDHRSASASITVAALIDSVLHGLTDEQKKSRLLDPRVVVARVLESAPRLPDEVRADRLRLLTEIGEDVLSRLCVLEIPTSRLNTGVSTSVLPQHQRLGRNVERDRRFRDCRHRLKDRGLCLLLFRYAGQEYHEIAALLALELDEVWDFIEAMYEVA